MILKMTKKWLKNNLTFLKITLYVSSSGLVFLLQLEGHVFSVVRSMRFR